MYKCIMSTTEAYSAAVRVMKRCDILAQISSEKEEGITRLYLSPEQLRANICVGEWMKSAGMTVWQDTVGNICGRYESLLPGAPALLLGSHLDTVRNAGRYDGILGVLSAIEIVQWLYDHQKYLRVAIEVVGFGDEEGTRFGITFLGSHGITGTWKDEWINYTDVDNITVKQAMQNAGLDAKKIKEAERKTTDIIAYLELHIEQGPCLEQEGLALGVVTAINGARRLDCHFNGEAGHAGTVPMIHRNDALVAAAEWVVFIERTTSKMNQKLVATVGKINCFPGAANVIPGKVNLTLDIRGPQDNAIDYLLSILLAKAENIALKRKLKFRQIEYYRMPVTHCDAPLQQILNQVIENIQGSTIQIPSGAGHDAIAIAERWPVGMLFIRNYRGISHHPTEMVQTDDVSLGIKAYLQAVYNLSTKLD
ncbi:AmaB protein [Candidatus Pantoea carbekii]|uniref:AmaB protein n=1 Tax=Candidatus Pantoea carbekii TaxID=1235990 RepID=U3U3N3_9GAMM|nr:AmaB protein [Candidatus Pantoea carbekii]